MKKFYILIIVTMFLLCGCDSRKDIYTPDNNYLNLNLTTYGKNFGYSAGSYWYLVDNNTGVVYLQTTHAITVMLNADGTPVTKDQLELED